MAEDGWTTGEKEEGGQKLDEDLAHILSVARRSDHPEQL